jgi:hypothetical protein
MDIVVERGREAMQNEPQQLPTGALLLWLLYCGCCIVVVVLWLLYCGCCIVVVVIVVVALLVVMSITKPPFSLSPDEQHLESLMIATIDRLSAGSNVIVARIAGGWVRDKVAATTRTIAASAVTKSDCTAYQDSRTAMPRCGYRH